MNISIKEAILATGKGEATIRRLINKEESKPFIEQKKGKIYIDTNYLFSVYEARKEIKKNDQIQQKNDRHNDDQIDIIKLSNKIELLEQQIKLEKIISEEKDKRIADLQNSIKLLEYKSTENPKFTAAKKKWWKLW